MMLLIACDYYAEFNKSKPLSFFVFIVIIIICPQKAVDPASRFYEHLVDASCFCISQMKKIAFFFQCNIPKTELWSVSDFKKKKAEC